MRPGTSTRLGVILGLLVLGADQGSKYWILNFAWPNIGQMLGAGPVNVHDLPSVPEIELLPVLNLAFVGNPGVTFGLLNGLGPWSHYVLAVIAILVVGVLCVWLRRAENALVAVSIGAIAGGALGNVIDRLRYGWVVDFIKAHVGQWSWYVFNIADAAIVCGVAVLILESQIKRRPRQPDTVTRHGPA